MELSLGMRGKNVLDLQRRLNILGFYRGSLEGLYGPALTRAVAEFRSVNGLGEAEGIADAKTLALLHSGHAAAGGESSVTSEGIDTDEVQRHLEHLQGVTLEDDSTMRQRLLIEGFMEFDPRFLGMLGR